jgi:hypothetical protein
MRLGPLRRKPQLHLRPESLALPKVTLGIKRETPQHLVLHLLSILHLALDFVHQRIQVCRGFPSGHAAVAVCRRGPVGCGRLRGGEEFEFDGDGGGGAAGYGVEDVAGYEGAVCHGGGLDEEEGWWCWCWCWCCCG